MHTILIKKEYKVSDEDIDDTMCSALEGGITYWCRKVKVVGEYLGEYASDQISRGGDLILYDAEREDRWTLTLDLFLHGLKLAIEQGYFSGDFDDMDAGIADVIVQLALFDEVVFG